MTPDKDGYMYWQPGQEKPRDEDICDVEMTSPYDGMWMPTPKFSTPVRVWEGIPRRYRLSAPTISPQDVRVGDMVTLKPGPAKEVEWASVYRVGGSGWSIGRDEIATVTRPKPDPIGELEGVIADLESSQWPRAKVCADTLRRVAGMLNKEREG